MPNKEFQEIFSTFDLAEIAFVKSIFAANHIQYEIQDENSSVYLLSVPSRFLVSKTQMEFAKTLLKDLNKTKSPTE